MFANVNDLLVEAAVIWSATGAVFAIALAFDAPPLVNVVLVGTTALFMGSLFFLRMVRTIRSTREEARR